MVLRFSSGSRDTGQRREEAVLGVDHLQRHAGGLDEVALDLLRLARPEQAVVDEHAREAVADGPLHEGRGHRRVDAAGEPAQHPLVAHPRARMAATCSSMTFVGRPGGLGAGDLVEEVLEHGLPVLGVEHLGVELHARHAPRRVLEGGDLGPGRAGRHLEARRGRRDTESPWLIHTDWPVGQAVEQRRVGRRDRERGAPELGQPGALDGAAERQRHGLEPVADAEGGDAGLEERRVDARRARRRTRTRVRRRGSARPAGGPASPPPASCGGRSRCRRAPRAPGGRSAGRTAPRSRRRGPVDPAPCS